MRNTRPSFSAVAQTEPAPTAFAGWELAPIGIVSVTRFVRGSIRSTEGRAYGTNQTPSLPAATVDASTSIVATSFPV